MSVKCWIIIKEAFWADKEMRDFPLPSLWIDNNLAYQHAKHAEMYNKSLYKWHIYFANHRDWLKMNSIILREYASDWYHQSPHLRKNQSNTSDALNESTAITFKKNSKNMKTTTYLEKLFIYWYYSSLTLSWVRPLIRNTYEVKSLKTSLHFSWFLVSCLQSSILVASYSIGLRFGFSTLSDFQYLIVPFLSEFTAVKALNLSVYHRQIKL